MRILYITTIGATMEFFNSTVRELVTDGHTVDIACSEADAPVLSFFRELGCKVYPLSCSRSIKDVGNLKSIREIQTLALENQYDIVHCHTPIAAACTRVACRKARKTGTKVVYTAHGFHFFKGAPLVNWLLFYPVEWLCSFWTDILITINQEDFARAKKLHAKQVEYIPGVGIDINKFDKLNVDRAEKRRELGIPEDSFVLLSVGEVNQNKNHQVIIRAMAELNAPQIHYLIAGKGDQREALEQLAQELMLSERVHFLGYREDINELMCTADIYAHPSFREGLPVALMEAMASGLPCVTSDIRGSSDLIGEQGGYRCNPWAASEFSKAIRCLIESPEQGMMFGIENRKKIESFSQEIVSERIYAIYRS